MTQIVIDRVAGDQTLHETADVPSGVSQTRWIWLSMRQNMYTRILYVSALSASLSRNLSWSWSSEKIFILPLPLQVM
jgi:hypothetical protein